MRGKKKRESVSKNVLSVKEPKQKIGDAEKRKNDVWLQSGLNKRQNELQKKNGKGKYVKKKKE